MDIHLDPGYPDNVTPPPLISENESLQRHNRKLSNALRTVIGEVRDHKYQIDHAATVGIPAAIDEDLYSAVEEIAAEFGGLYGSV